MDFTIGEMASLLEGTRVGHEAPSMEEYLIGTNENSLNDKLVPGEEIIKLYGLPEEVHCVAYPLKRQNTEDRIIGHSSGHGASFYDPIVSITRTFHESVIEVIDYLTYFNSSSSDTCMHITFSCMLFNF
jgi:hypothetical protein